MKKNIFISISLIISFFFQSIGPVLAVDMQALLPAPGAMTGVSPAFVPASLKGVRLQEGATGLQLEFVLTRGQANLPEGLARENVERLVSYFLSALTLPGDEMWVNLSPHEGNRIIPDKFGVTAMGRDLLGQDYLLKQLTASLIYPEKDIGKKFWDEVYRRAQQKFGTTDIPVDTFNKVWIMPDKATVYENGMAGFVVKSRLKVMLESDYLAAYNTSQVAEPPAKWSKARQAEQDDVKQILREIIIPAIEKEVNEGRQFATLRQIYDAQILAVWFKTALRTSVLGRVYADKGRVAGIDVNTPDVNEAVYERYLQAFKQGVFNYVKEEQDPFTQDILPRKYFSGGAVAVTVKDLAMVHELPIAGLADDAQLVAVRLDRSERSTRDNYLWDSHSRGLGEIFRLMPGVRIRLPFWDEQGVMVMKDEGLADYFIHVFNWQVRPWAQKIDGFAVTLKGLSNKKLAALWSRNLPASMPDSIRDIQSLIDALSLASGVSIAGKDLPGVWQETIERLLQTQMHVGGKKHLFMIFCEILRRWYKKDSRPNALGQDYRRMIAVLSGVTMLTHGGGNAPAMDFPTLMQTADIPLQYFEVHEGWSSEDLLMLQTLSGELREVIKQYRVFEKKVSAMEKDLIGGGDIDKDIKDLKGEVLLWIDRVELFLKNYINKVNYMCVMSRVEVLVPVQKSIDKALHQADAALSRLLTVYLPAIRLNILGEKDIRARLESIDLQAFVDRHKDTFQTKDGWKEYPGAVLHATQGQRFFVKAAEPLLTMVLERLEENARSYLAYLARTPEAMARLGKALRAEDLRTTYALSRGEIGPDSIRLTITNPGEIIPKQVLGRNQESYEIDPLKATVKAKGVQRMFEWDPNRPQIKEGGTSMPFVGVAVWNMGAILHVENFVDTDGIKKVRFTIDFAQAEAQQGFSVTDDVADVGGIDLNEKHLLLDIERHGMAGDMAATVADDLQEIDGFQPVVVSIAPISDLAGYLRK